MTNKRIGKIELLRFIFSVLIVFGHFESTLKYEPIKFSFFNLNRFYMLGVEFFFLLSGYFLAKSIEKESSNNPSKTTIKYLLKRIKSFLPEHLISCLLTLITAVVLSYESIQNAIYHIILSLPAFVLLPGWGFYERIMNHEWYISNLLLISTLLYPVLLKKNKVFNRIICPITSLILLSYIVSTTNDLSIDITIRLFSGFLSIKTVRALAEIMLGIFMYEVVTFIKRYKYNNYQKMIFTLIELVSYLLCFLIVNMDYIEFQIYFLFIMFIALTISLSKVSLIDDIFNNKICLLLGKLSLPMYMCHMFVINLVNIFNIANSNRMLQAIFVLSITIIVSYIIKATSDIIRKKIDQRLIK